MRLSNFVAMAVSSAAFAASAATVNLFQVAKVDLSATSDSVNNAPQYIGSNPCAVAWDGSNAWVAGYNASGGTANSALIKVSNVLGTPTLGSAFGALAVPNTRGATGLALQGNNLAIGVDTGAGSGDSVRLFDTTTETLTWRIGTAAADSTRRANGVAFDPGFNGGGTNQGVAYLSIGSGRRHLLNTTTGAYINGQNAGAIINFAPTSTTWRDVEFDPATGDLYSRESNRVGKAVRSGDNAFTGAASTVIAAYTTANLIDNQHLTFADIVGEKVIFANDRNVTTAGQVFTTVIKSVTTGGTANTLNWDFGAFGTPATGNGAYDFSFDPSTQTLAVVDFANRQLYVFAVPEPASLGLLAFSGIALLRRRE